MYEQVSAPHERHSKNAFRLECSFLSSSSSSLVVYVVVVVVVGVGVVVLTTTTTMVPKKNDDVNDDFDDIKDDDNAKQSKKTIIQSVLVSGYRRFRRNTMCPKTGGGKTMDERLKRLSREGQKGACKILCVSCCDSRCDPTWLFDSQPGEIFSVRNVANVVPPCCVQDKESNKDDKKIDHGTISAIEYAVKSLEVEAIVVLGHAQCGGCAHALHLFSPKTSRDDIHDDRAQEKLCRKSAETETSETKDFYDGSGSVDAWCGHIEESVKYVCSKYDTEDERLRALEHENVRRSVENVKTYPFVRERIAKGELLVRGGFFTIFSGEVAMMDEDTKAFTPIEVSNDTTTRVGNGDKANDANDQTKKEAAALSSRGEEEEEEEETKDGAKRRKKT